MTRDAPAARPAAHRRVIAAQRPAGPVAASRCPGSGLSASVWYLVMPSGKSTEVLEECCRRRYRGRCRRCDQRCRGDPGRNCEPGCCPGAVPGREHREDDGQGGPGGGLHGACRAKGDGRCELYSPPSRRGGAGERQAEQRQHWQISEPCRQRQGQHRRAEGERRAAQRPAWRCHPERRSENRSGGDAHPEPGIAGGAVQTGRCGQSEDRHRGLVRVVVQDAGDLTCGQIRSAMMQQQSLPNGPLP